MFNIQKDIYFKFVFVLTSVAKVPDVVQHITRVTKNTVVHFIFPISIISIKIDMVTLFYTFDFVCVTKRMICKHRAVSVANQILYTHVQTVCDAINFKRLFLIHEKYLFTYCVKARS